MEAIVRAVSAGGAHGVMLETFKSGAGRESSLFRASAVCLALSYGLCHIWTTFWNAPAPRRPQSDFICALPRSESFLP